MLGLEMVGESDVVTPTTGPEAVKKRLWRGTITFQAGNFECTIPRVEMLEGDVANQGFSLLLGRDVLNRLTVLWDGTNKRATVFV